MPQPEWEALSAEVRDLARRVAYLEQQLGAAPALSETVVDAPPESPVLHPIPAGLVPLAGQCLLGVAGAYLLRALTEAGTLRLEVGVACAILYSIAWLAWAARTPAVQRIEAALRSLTSVLILCPLLWETVHLHAVSTPVAGLLLLAFSVTGLVVSWRKNLQVVALISTLTGLGGSLALLMATYDVMPFAWVMLAITAAVEVSACMDHWLGQRWTAAIVTDFTLVLATWLVTNEHGLPPDYAPISTGLLLAALSALLLVYLASTTVRTLGRGRRFTGFEMTQSLAAVAIAANGAVRLSEHNPGLVPVIGAFALICAAACYLVSFRLLDRDGMHHRIFFTYTTFGLLLAVAGTSWLLQGPALPAVWAVAAIGAMWAGGFHERLTLQVHGAIYLALALAVSGAAQHATSSLLTAMGEHEPIDAAVVLALLVSAACYRLSSPGQRVLRLVLAASLAWLAAGLLASGFVGVYHAVFGMGASRAYCATLRTTVLAGGALLLAWAGPRWRRIELSQLAYGLAAFGAWRLVAADWRQDGKTAFLLSLLALGATLIVLPRLWRRA